MHVSWSGFKGALSLLQYTFQSRGRTGQRAEAMGLPQLVACLLLAVPALSIPTHCSSLNCTPPSADRRFFPCSRRSLAAGGGALVDFARFPTVDMDSVSVMLPLSH